MRKELFDEAVGVPPLSTVDLAAVMARQDRLRRTRRGAAAVTGAVAVALAVAVVLGLPAQLRADRAPEPAIPSPSVSALVPPSPSGTPVASGEEKAARVEAAWQRVLPRVLPGARWRAGRDDPAGPRTYDKTFKAVPPPLSTQTNADELDPVRRKVPWHTSIANYRTFGVVRFGGVESQLFFETQWRAVIERDPAYCAPAPDGVFTCRSDTMCEPPTKCRQLNGPNGELILIRNRSERLQGLRLPLVSRWVWVRSADGTRVASLDQVNRVGTDGGPEPTTTRLALTEQQMIDILLEPGLMI